MKAAIMMRATTMNGVYDCELRLCVMMSGVLLETAST